MTTVIRTTRATTKPYPRASPSNPRLNSRKKPWMGRSHQLSRWRGSCGLRSTAHMAGDRVSDTTSEITVALAIVSANWR